MADKRRMSYSEAMAELERIVERIDAGEVDVDALAESVKQAVGLARMCRERLRSAQADVEQALSEMEEPPTGAARGAKPAPALTLDVLAETDAPEDG